MPYIFGRNPVLEALQHGRPVQKIYLQFGQQNDKIRTIYKLAKAQKIAITNVDPRKIKQLAGNNNHQGIVALIAPMEIGSFDALVNNLPALPRPWNLIILDRIQDPHNMGAIIRSAEILGVQALIYSDRENVPVNDTVMKASSGAALHLPIYKAGNLSQALAILKEQQIWIYGAALENAQPLWGTDFVRDCAVIIGNEEKGIRPGLLKHCDGLFYIPQSGKTQSLNASVAAGIALCEIVRQRQTSQ